MALKKAVKRLPLIPFECNKLHPPPICKGGDYSVLPFSWWTNF